MFHSCGLPPLSRTTRSRKVRRPKQIRHSPNATNKLHRHAIRQPDAVVGTIEREPCGRHSAGLHDEHNGFAVSRADGSRGVLIARQMHMMSRAGHEAALANGIEVLSCRAVIEHIGRRDFDMVQVHGGGGVSLRGAYA